MPAVLAPTAVIHAWTALATNSGPLSERTWPGTPRRMQDEEIGQDLEHVRGLELAGDPDRQAFVRELVDDIEHPVLPAVVGAILDEVVGPDVVGALGPQPEAGAVRQPEPAALGLLLGELEPLAPPSTAPLSIARPACR